MNTDDLEIAIREAIKRIYCFEYCGRLHVKRLHDCHEYKCDHQCTCYLDDPGVETGYELILGLNVDERPLRIAFSGNAKSFLKFIIKELRERRLHMTKYYKGYKTDSTCNIPCECTIR